MERERELLLVQTFKQLNTQHHRRLNITAPPLAVYRVKVTFKDEPGEGSGVARSFYTAFAQVHPNKHQCCFNIGLMFMPTLWIMVICMQIHLTSIPFFKVGGGWAFEKR